MVLSDIANAEVVNAEVGNAVDSNPIDASLMLSPPPPHSSIDQVPKIGREDACAEDVHMNDTQVEEAVRKKGRSSFFGTVFTKVREQISSKGLPSVFDEIPHLTEDEVLCNMFEHCKSSGTTPDDRIIEDRRLQPLCNTPSPATTHC
eukprot:scaffold8358_cov319-Ochromonas_danica.AAC.1